MTGPTFTVRAIGANPHRPGTISWRAGQIVTALEGCSVFAIIAALTAFERDATPSGVGDPARWLTQFAGLESDASGKAVDPWIEIRHSGQVVGSTAAFRELLRRMGP